MPTIAAATASVAAAGTPAASNSGANARPVAGPPVSVTDPASTPINGCCPSAIATPAPITFCMNAMHGREQEEDDHRRTTDAQQRHACAEPDGREERDHQRRLQRRVELDRIPEVGPIERQEDRDEQPADDRRGDVVFGERRDDAADEISCEQHHAREGDGLNQVQRHEGQSTASRPTCRSAGRGRHVEHGSRDLRRDTRKCVQIVRGIRAVRVFAERFRTRCRRHDACSPSNLDDGRLARENRGWLSGMASGPTGSR